jgi:hypothetical protein
VRANAGSRRDGTRREVKPAPWRVAERSPADASGELREAGEALVKPEDRFRDRLKDRLRDRLRDRPWFRAGLALLAGFALAGAVFGRCGFCEKSMRAGNSL